jgi:hypothetical protein
MTEAFPWIRRRATSSAILIALTAPSSLIGSRRWASGIEQPRPARLGRTDTSNALSARSDASASTTECGSAWRLARRLSLPRKGGLVVVHRTSQTKSFPTKNGNAFISRLHQRLQRGSFNGSAMTDPSCNHPMTLTRGGGALLGRNDRIVGLTQQSRLQVVIWN